MNKRLTTDMADANGLQRAIRLTTFQHQENGCRFLQCTMHNGQYWVFNMRGSDYMYNDLVEEIWYFGN